MSGTLTPLGVVSVGTAVKGMNELMALLEAAYALAAAQLSGKLAGALSVQLALTLPQLPTAKVEAAAKVAIQLALNPNIAVPSLQVTGNAALIAELRLKLASLVLPDLGLGAAGVAAYRYEGTVDLLGSKIAQATSNGLPGGTSKDVCFATLLVTTAPAAAAALAKILI